MWVPTHLRIKLWSVVFVDFLYLAGPGALHTMGRYLGSDELRLAKVSVLRQKWKKVPFFST
jgi:hypothetical protein